MENWETFTLSINYKGTPQLVEVSTELPVGPEPLTANYTITLQERTFIINPAPALSQSDVPAWKLISGVADKELVQLVGEAIERHYL